MDFTLNEEQRAWQDKARKFAEEEIRPVSLARDRILDPQGNLGLGAHQEGLEARLSHAGRSEGSMADPVRTT